MKTQSLNLVMDPHLRSLSFHPGVEKIPKDAIIISAEFEILGLGITGMLKQFTHTYSDTINNKAWSGITTNHPPSANPTTYQTNVFSNTDYSNVAKSDNIRAMSSAKGALNYPYQLFNFKATETGITNIGVLWEGYGQLNPGTGRPSWEAFLYIWNVTNSSWELIGSNRSIVQPTNDFVIQKSSVGTPIDYIDKSGNIYLMAQGPLVIDAQSSSDIDTDFVKVIITGLGTVFPTNPTLNVGADDDIAGWYDKPARKRQRPGP